ncbi:hypothetical protein ACFX5K_00620 [Rickettsiales bacterium LUAb2]
MLHCIKRINIILLLNLTFILISYIPLFANAETSKNNLKQINYSNFDNGVNNNRQNNENSDFLYQQEVKKARQQAIEDYLEKHKYLNEKDKQDKLNNNLKNFNNCINSIRTPMPNEYNNINICKQYFK